MTESPPVWFIGDNDASESKIQRQVVEALEAADLEQDRPQLEGAVQHRQPAAPGAGTDGVVCG